MMIETVSKIMKKIMAYIRWIFIMVLGGVVIFWGARTSSALSKEAIDLSDPDTDWSELETGAHVEMDMEYILDYFTTTTEDGSERSRKYTYPKLEQGSDGLYEITDVIGINASKPKEFYLYDDLCEATYQWWIGNTEKVEADPIHIDGIVQKLDNDQIGFHEEYLEDMGFTSSEIEASHYELVVVSQDSPKMVMIIGVVILLVGLAGVAIVTFRK